jgi:CheY-like chemotaxis protein
VTATGAPEAAARRILIVDDSAIVRHTVAHMLRRLGFVPIEAADGEEALVKIRRSPPDAVILDIHMP